MGLLNSFSFKHFEIKAYKDVNCSKPVMPKGKAALVFGARVLMYRFPFNPSSFKITHLNKFNTRVPIGYDGNNPKYIATEARILSVELVIDPNAEPLDVLGIPSGLPPKATLLSLAERIDIFEDIVGYQSSSHRPNYLQINWGDTVSMKATLKEYNISYKRFDENGQPTKANIQAEFMEVISAKNMLKKQGRQSPDVSHLIEIEEGDTLPQLCERIYGDAKHYINIAKINKLKSFRNLQAGLKLYFPPLK